MNITSREYKLLINHEPFQDMQQGIAQLLEELRLAIPTQLGVTFLEDPKEDETRPILFLDTPSHTFRQSGLILRRRGAGKDTEYTLKCRSEDRYFAAKTRMTTTSKFSLEQKLEEDIAAPFVCRYSHSGTITTDTELPKTLREAKELFPMLGRLSHDEQPVGLKTAVRVVNNLKVTEKVWKLGKLNFRGTKKNEPISASLALILWTRTEKSYPVIAELSFRIKGKDKNKDEDIAGLFTRDLAQQTRSTYQFLQRLDCARQDGITKTEFIYRDSSRD